MSALPTLLHMRLSISIFVAALCAPAIGYAAEPPGKILDLSAWKLTLPLDTPHPGRPDEIVMPQVATFVAPGIFQANDDATGVLFRAPCGGFTTSGSGYPRCELREMRPGGKGEIAWNTTDETVRSLVAALAVTHVPAVKPHMVCAQIHDAKDDLLMVRLEGKKLFVERNGDKDVELEKNYQLGTLFNLKIEAGGGRIREFYNDVQKLDWTVARRGCFFKAGCYTQSNVKKGDLPDDYGEVLIRQIQIQPAAAP
jgi:hypothetical protein